MTRCFSPGATAPTNRPSPNEWVRALTILAAGPRTCAANTRHRFRRGPTNSSANIPNGSLLGVKITWCHPAFMSLAVRPARSNEDFPEPEGPITITGLASSCPRMASFIRSAVSRARPQKYLACSGSRWRGHGTAAMSGIFAGRAADGPGSAQPTTRLSHEDPTRRTPTATPEPARSTSELAGDCRQTNHRVLSKVPRPLQLEVSRVASPPLGLSAPNDLATFRARRRSRPVSRSTADLDCLEECSCPEDQSCLDNDSASRGSNGGHATTIPRLG
jgi:hypothetical protein